jgi:hypothetical protein
MRSIDADALMKKVCGNCQRNDCTPDATDTVYGCMFAESINQMPTIEPKVRHGRWIPTEYDSYADGAPVWDKWECSECGHEHRGEEDTLTLFCPNCGAKMYQTGGMISKERFAEIAEIGGADND